MAEKLWLRKRQAGFPSGGIQGARVQGQEFQAIHSFNHVTARATLGTASEETCSIGVLVQGATGGRLAEVEGRRAKAELGCALGTGNNAGCCRALI